jgi:chromosome segregation ATPase
MLRVALILAALASIAGLSLSLFVTKPAMDALNTDRNDTKAALASEKTARGKAEAEAKSQKALAESKAKELSETKSELETAQTEATNQKNRADKLQGEYEKASQAKNLAQAALERWNALGVQPDQVLQLRVDLKNLKEAKTAVDSENKTLARTIDGLQARLDRYEGDGNRIVEMPGLKGTVAAVDAKWNFIILDAGSNQGAKENGVVIVRRGDKLIGKAKITRVEGDRSYANVIGDWTQGNSGVAVGDAFLY